MSYEGITYNDRDWMIGYNIRNLEMAVGPWPDKTDWSRRYDYTTGCCYALIENLPDEEIAERLRGEALHMISLGVPLATVFQEFAKIRIWRDMTVKLTGGDYVAFYDKKGYLEMNPYHP